MVGEQKAMDVLEYALRRSPGDQSEAVFMATQSYVTRYSDNRIHQNTAEMNASLSVRVVLGKRTGTASTNRLDKASVAGAVERAAWAASFQVEDPDFVSLPGPAPCTGKSSYCSCTADFAPEARAEGVGMAIEEARARGLSGAGAFSTSVTEIAVANSLGIRCYQTVTLASFKALAMEGEASGFGAQYDTDVSRIDPREVGRTAAEKCRLGTDPVDLEPGDYPVILEEVAVAELAEFLGYLGFGALAFQEGRSFMSGRLGEKLASDSISIWDDGQDPGGVMLAFDFEGVPKSRVPLIGDGVARGVVYDSYTAGREAGKVSTGHALPAPNPHGPIPLNLIMACGPSSPGEMIRSTNRGVLVTRFHYTNVVHAVKTVITGMTRDGTFLVENGEIVKAVKNLRFTQSILEALNEVEAVGSQGKLVAGELGSAVVPALKLGRFRFTGGV